MVDAYESTIPGLTFSQDTELFADCFFLDCQILEIDPKDPTMQTLEQNQARGSRVYLLPTEPGGSALTTLISIENVKADRNIGNPLCLCGFYELPLNGALE